MELMNNVRYVGAQHPDRKLFDALIPLPEGTSYNAYLVQGEKVALIDTVDPSKWDVLKGHLHGLERLDYVIAIHAEQDQSGSLPLCEDRHEQDMHEDAHRPACTEGG